jgi:hypothetical protein
MGADVKEVKRTFVSCLMFLGNCTVHDTTSYVSIKQNMCCVEFALFPAMSCFMKTNNVLIQMNQPTRCNN